MSENSDAIVIVVSEETGQISVALNGELTRDYTREKLKTLLEENIFNDRTEISIGRRKLFSSDSGRREKE
jgi:diadenylate cyclase